MTEEEEALVIVCGLVSTREKEKRNTAWKGRIGVKILPCEPVLFKPHQNNAFRYRYIDDLNCS